ncbi:MAG: threonine synthase [Caldilineaceae bacterium]|nr:threonine synthase [Caldilineaceae bacterium]
MTEIATQFSLECSRCEWHGPDADISLCPDCDGILVVAYADPAIEVRPEQPGLWRYGAHLPLRDVASAVSLGEGNTPLLRSGRLEQAIGVRELHFKLEGSNPTGSYKDRIAAVGMARLRELGKRAWAATSSGNAGAAMAAYGVRAGVDGYLFTLEKAARAKIAQIMAYGPQVMAVERMGYDPAAELSAWANIRKVCQANEWLMLVTAHAFSPHAMEGVKTISYEIAEQLQGEVPDVVYVPVGGGGLCAAIWRGFVEWQAAGYATRTPRIVAVQPAGCDAIHQAWLKGSSKVEPIAECKSDISGLQLAAPADGELVLQTLAASGGWSLTIDDEATYAAQAKLARQEGLFVEPAAAISLAGVEADRATGRLRGDERVVCVLTGIGFKDANAIQRMVEHVPLPLIKADEILLLAGR